MPTILRRTAYKQFMSPEQGSQYPVFDLSGENQRIKELHQSLNGVLDLLAGGLTRQVRKLLGHEALRASCEGWGNAAPEEPEYWLSAFTPDQPTHPVLLGLDRRALFSLSELFFGGQPQKISDKQLDKRVLADTERRLCNRLLNLVLNLICPSLDLPLSDWQSTWLEPGAEPSTQALWCPVSIAGNDWSLTLNIGWPLAKSCRPPALSEDDAEHFSAQMENKLQQITASLKVELATMTLSLAELGGLKVGDIIPVDLSSETRARAGDSTLLKGLVCESNNRLALRITHIVGEYE